MFIASKLHDGQTYINRINMYTCILARYGKGTVCMKTTKTMHNDMIKCAMKYIEGEWISIAFIYTCCYLQWKKC